MSDLSEARVLRLERLESRSLLAAGVLDFALDPGNAATEQLPAATQQINTQRDSGRPGDFARNIPQSQNGPPQNPPAQIANELAANQRLADPAFQVPTPALSPTAPQLQVAQRPPGATDAALVSEPTTDAIADSALDFPTEEVSTVDSESTTRIVVTQALNVHENTFRRTFGDSPDIGFIELAPLDPLEPLTENSEPWQLDRSILPSLNRIADRALGEQPFGDRADVIDRLMQDWFSGPGGLIALEQISLPANPFSIHPVIVDVGLQSTVALHRSLNDVAGSVAPALSGQVLDAIMASLERVTASATQPIIEPSPLRITTAIYPAAAVVVTTIAIAARRKQKHPQSNLQFTGGQ